jgi:hydrogenase nickel incorporation protein HypB
MDLAEAVEFDAAAARRNIHAVRPGMPLFESSVKTQAGLTEILEWMKSFRACP